MGLRFCVEHGIKGFATGVNPVPPSINDSKLNMPFDGVQTLIPAMSETFFLASASDGFMFDSTLRDDGRFGFDGDNLFVGINVGVFN
jgi:hypothetical protein